MARNQEKPRFIRKNGRVIPIGVDKDKARRARSQPSSSTSSRKTKKKKERKSLITQGLGFIGASLGLSALGSATAGKLFRKGAQTGEGVKSFTSSAGLALDPHSDPKFKALGERFLRRAANESKKATKTMKVSRGLFKLAPIAAMGIASIGASRLLEAAGTENEMAQDLGGVALGSSVTAVANKSFKIGAGRKLIKRIRGN